MVLGLQQVLLSKEVLNFVIKNIKENYYYIYSGWVGKISNAASVEASDNILIFGTSVSVYGVQSRDQVINLGLVAASAKQILETIKIVGASDHAIIELNPIAFSNRYLQTTDKFGLEKLFQKPFRTKIIDQIPLLKYGHLYRKAIEGILKPETLALDQEIKKMRDKEFEQIIKGNSDLDISHKRSKKAYDSCFALSSYSLKRGYNWNLLKEVIYQSRKRFRRVIFWVPRFNNDSLNLKAKPFYSKIEKILGKNYFSYQGLDDEYFDCQHLNSLGKIKLSKIIYQERI